MLLVVVLHTLYDASWSATPVLTPPLAWHWGALLLMASLLLTWMWVRSAYWSDYPLPRVMRDETVPRP